MAEFFGFFRIILNKTAKYTAKNSLNACFIWLFRKLSKNSVLETLCKTTTYRESCILV